MNKRDFMGAALLAGAAPAFAASKATPTTAGPVLLTLTGEVGKTNRGPFDPGRDIMMGKHKLAFSRAWACDFAAVAALPAVTIRPTLEYDGKVHTLRGPLLTDVLAAAGVRVHDGTRLALRALDGYAASVDAAQLRTLRFIVATHMDGQPMALGGLGPLWAVYDADRVPALAARPLAERFGSCPWGLYHIEVLA
ncbi:MAG TPA: molybdopterin-dependent oxidoreductase [Telluria sp.]|nr:molybdopterin-dependent oxidoreductase [Telluria sp.]